MSQHGVLYSCITIKLRIKVCVVVTWFAEKNHNSARDRRKIIRLELVVFIIVRVPVAHLIPLFFSFSYIPFPHFHLYPFYPLQLFFGTVACWKHFSVLQTSIGDSYYSPLTESSVGFRTLAMRHFYGLKIDLNISEAFSFDTLQ